MKNLVSILFFVIAQNAFANGNFSLKSTSIKPGQTIDNKYVFNSFGCTGENKSPELEWKNAPAGTKSFIVTAYDPDAPTGSGWWHWTVVNIPTNVTKLPEGASSETSLLPASAVQGRTDFGKAGYGGPCPPQGDRPHRYVFTVYAMKTDKLDINSDSPGAMVGFYAHLQSLASASLTAKYGR